MKEIMCKEVDGLHFFKWKCVLGRCKECPSYCIPDAEKDDSGKHMIKFHVYQKFHKCSIHSVENINDENECTKCTELEGT